MQIRQQLHQSCRLHGVGMVMSVHWLRHTPAHVAPILPPRPTGPLRVAGDSNMLEHIPPPFDSMLDLDKPSHCTQSM